MIILAMNDKVLYFLQLCKVNMTVVLFNVLRFCFIYIYIYIHHIYHLICFSFLGQEEGEEVETILISLKRTLSDKAQFAT